MSPTNRPNLYCPLSFSGKTNMECFGEKCAWFYRGYCSVNILARQAVENTIKSEKSPYDSK